MKVKVSLPYPYDNIRRVTKALQKRLIAVNVIRNASLGITMRPQSPLLSYIKISLIYRFVRLVSANQGD